MADTGLRRGVVDGAGVRLGYVEAGPAEGVPVLLLPGWPQTAYVWRRVLPRLAEAGRRAIALDLPGQGASGFMPEGAASSADAVAEVVLDALRALGVEQADVAAHDVGGWVAFSLASHHPQAVRRLVLLETQLLGVSPAPQVQNAPRAFQYFFNSVPGLGEMLTRGREREFLSFLFESKSL